MPHHLADRDLGRRSRQLQSAVATSGGADETGGRQILDDLHQVVLRDIMRFGNLSDRHQTAIAGREEDQRAQGIVGVAGQLHFSKIEAFH